MSKTTVFVAVFVFTALFCAALAWLCGYDFDHRGGIVAAYTGWCFLLSLGTGVIAVMHPDMGDKE